MNPAGKGGNSLRAVPRIPKRPPGMERLPLSGVQMQMWFLDQLVPGSPAYHIPRALRLTGELDVDLLARAVADVVRRHEILRTAYVYADGAPWQVVMPEVDGLLEVEDLSAIPAGEVEDVIQARALASALGPFDFASGRLVRFHLIKRDATSHVLVVTMHHICIDGVSVPVVFGEIAECYAAHRAGKPVRIPEPEIQFADYVLWQQERMRTEAYRRHLAYWEKQLAGLPQLEFPADRPRPPMPTYCGGRATRDLPADVVSGVRALANEAGVTLLIVLAAAFAATLHRYTDQDEIVIGTATTGRGAPGLADVVGCFVNALVLRIDVSGDPAFTELIRRARDVIFGAWEHREVPFESVVALVAPQRERSRNPLYQVWMQLVDAGSADIDLPVAGILADDYEIAAAITPLDLSLNVIDKGTGLAFRAEFATDLFDRSRVERLLGHLERVLRAVAVDPGLRVSGLPLLGERERELVSGVWQGADAEQAAGPVHGQIAVRAAADPGAVAAVAGSRVLSYGELDAESGRLAGRLAGMGVVAGDVVAVALERGCELLVALVGVLKAGAAFVVVDPEHPAARLEFIFADTRARVVVTDARIGAGLPAGGLAVLAVDGDRELTAAVPVRGELVGADAAAYVLYTSGSTGTPKGVVVEHHALTTFTLWLSGVFGLGPGTRMVHHMALIFDFAIGEIFTALVSGATLVFVAERDRLSPEAIGDLLEREHITYLGGPPAMLAAIPDRPYPDLRYLVAGGEAFPGDLVNRWNTPGRRFINGYGPTEAAVGCIYYECEHRAWSNTPPIGRPMPRRYAYVLDGADNLCPIGVPGEIVVGGAGLARGYLNQPELTRQRFTPDPVRPGGRIYRTGDLGMWTPDGQIQFLGRIDSQVKLNGLRIELEEIESVLADHPAIAAAAVAVHGEGAARRLIGYVVPASGAGPDTAGLGGWLAARLPRYMIPAVFTVLDRLPLTRVGKIDRAALPAPDLAPAHAEPPATLTEHQVAAIFTAILNRDRISRDDNFFALGGTSIQAARAVLRLRSDIGVEVNLGTFYAAPAVADIAQAVEEARTAAAAQDDQAAEIAELERRLALARGQAPARAPLDGADTRNLPARASRRHAEVLLTGATGFFGAFLLEELLTRTSGVVHCLVRAATEDEGERRLRDNLHRYGREYVAQDPRVKVVRGDLRLPRLGLDEAEYDALASRIDTIVHAGAHVDLLLPYSGLESANVGGTRSVIELATARALKEVHIVSSVSAVVGAGLDPGSYGYAVSKWRAELVAQAARERGVPIAIYRMPRLSGDSRTGVSNSNDVVVRLMRSFQQMGTAPAVTAVEEWIPVNFAARTLIDTALSHPDGGLFVLQPPSPVEIRRVIEFAAETSPLVVKPPGQFIEDVSQRFPEAGELIGFILSRSASDFAIDDAGIGPFETVPADGVSDDLLRRYLHMWAPEAGELS